MEAVLLELIHNPYTVTTQLAQICDGEKTYISEMHELSPILHDRLIWWVNPHDDWPGFFALLPAAFHSDRFVIRFHGLRQDYDRLVKAYALQKEQLSISVSFEFTGGGLEADYSPEAKLEKMRLWRSTLEEVGSPAARDNEIEKAFDSLLNNELEIITSAPVNAGKSTLQNAIIGMRLLPTSSRAKTSVPTRVRLDQSLDAFTLNVRTEQGTEAEPTVTRKRVEQLNDTLSAGVDISSQPVICLEGPLVRCQGDSGELDKRSIKPVFTDCPGINNANNALHKAITQQFLKHKNMNLVLFVFNPKTLDHLDTMEALDDTLDSVCDGILSSRDRILLQDHVIFVCNQVDKYDEDYDDLFFAVKSMLASRGILMPKLHLVCARSAELIRTQNRNRELIARDNRKDADLLTRTEAAELDFLIDRFSGHRDGAEDETDALYRYCTLSEHEKAAMASQTARLREENTPDTGAEIALLHSGVPGLEHLLTQYLDCCALPIKLRVFRDQVVTRYHDLSAKAREALHAAEQEADALKAALQQDRERYDVMSDLYDKVSDRSNYTWSEQTAEKLYENYMEQVDGIKYDLPIGKIRNKITYSEFSTYCNIMINSFRSLFERRLIKDYELANSLRDDWKEICKNFPLAMDYNGDIPEWDPLFAKEIPPIQYESPSWDFKMEIYETDCSWHEYFGLLYRDLREYVRMKYICHTENLRQEINKSLDVLWPYIQILIRHQEEAMDQKSEEIRAKEQRYAQLQQEIAEKLRMVDTTTHFFTDVMTLLELPLPPERQEEIHDSHVPETEF